MTTEPSYYHKVGDWKFEMFGRHKFGRSIRELGYVLTAHFVPVIYCPFCGTDDHRLKKKIVWDHWEEPIAFNIFCGRCCQSCTIEAPYVWKGDDNDEEDRTIVV